jgi:hypothetical protein
MADSPDLIKLRTDAAALKAQRDQAVAGIAQKAAQLTALKAQIAHDTLAGNAAAAAAARAQHDQIARLRAQEAASVIQLDNAARDAIGRGIAHIDPCDSDPAYPLLLLPVRLETRYTVDGSALRVRIFPDDIHIDHVSRGVSDAENGAAVAYWNAVWRSADTDAAWATLVTQVGRRRALWVALATQPSNIARRKSDPAPTFNPPTPLTRTGAVARLLPDRFTVMASQGGETSLGTGNPIASSVPVALYADDGTALTDVNGVKVSAGREWLVDYSEAERIGMAVTLRLKRPRQSVDRLLVFGVRVSLDPAAAAKELESLLTAHRCNPGLAFVPQGTPTNNTETDHSAWQRAIEPKAPARDPVPPQDARANASVLGAALGIDPTALAELDHAGEQEQSRARAMNVAMWGPSWGSFLDKINKVDANGAAVTDGTREAARQLHRDAVRGRGPMPAIRVGNQPYGILPVSSLDKRWVPDQGATFERDLLGLLRRIRATWRGSLDSVPQLGKGDVDETMRELLGSAAVSQGLRVRAVIAGWIWSQLHQAAGAAIDDAFIQSTIEQMIWEELVAHASSMFPFGLLASSLPLPLPMVDKTDPDFIKATVAGQAPGATSALQVLVGLSWDRATQEVNRTSAFGHIIEIAGHVTALSAAEREQMVALASRAAHVDAGTLTAAAARVRQAIGAPTPPTLLEYQPVKAYQRSFGELALDSTSAANRAQFGGFALQVWFDACARLNELTAALAELEQTELEERRILFAESLDIAAHRVDAWLTALVENRRRTLRTAHANGIVIGAYGWVENIMPTGQRELDGGYVHAPSLNHAVTAGVLRSAYLSHNADMGGDRALSIDLTSARVRESLHLIDGMRQGQPLGALLGYQIERAMHEIGLDRFILSLRKIAPRFQGKLSDRGETLQPSALEAVTANSIVDGVTLVHLLASGFDISIRRRLDEAPADNPYLTKPWQPPTDAEWRSILAIIQNAQQALESVSSLMIAESVHQMVQGNMARASAALDAAATGDAIPPTPQVITTPEKGLPVTHSLLLIAAGTASWNAARPRAAAEPHLEGWAAERLGDPATIVVAMDQQGAPITLAASGFCALDVVYDAAERTGFERRLRARLNALPAATPLAETRAADWPQGLRAIGDVLELAASMRSLLVAARPATPLDLVLPNASGPNAPPTRQINAASLAEARARAQNAHDVLTLRAASLGALLTQGTVTATALGAAVETLADYGIVAPSTGHDQLSAVAHLAFAEAHRRLKVSEDALAAPVTADTVSAAGQALFGVGFWILPAIAPNAGPDAWDAALAAPPPGAGATAARTVLADLASVRDGVRRYDEALLLAEAVGHAGPPRVAQLAGLGKVPPTGWIDGRLDTALPTPDVPISSYVMDVGGTYSAGQPTFALVVDQWVELLPVRERRGEAADAPVNARHTTGVAFNAATPLSRPPQALLLAIAPDNARWTTPAVMDVLEDALDLAKIRAVTLERTNGAAAVLPALYEQSWSLQGEKALDLGAILAVASQSEAMLQFIKEG